MDGESNVVEKGGAEELFAHFEDINLFIFLLFSTTQISRSKVANPSLVFKNACVKAFRKLFQ